MDSSVLLVLLLSCMTQAVGARMELLPETLTVLRGEEARWTCSTSNLQWTVMVWLLNGASVLTISKEHGILPSNNPNVTAEDGSSPQRASWVFVLRRTERRQQGQVTCDLQNIQRKTASLFVQEKGSVRLFGGNRTALRGQWVLFECQAAGWYPQPSLEWLVNGKEVGQGEHNISSEVSAEGLFTVASNLSIQAAESAHVDCLASVSALPRPLISGIQLTVVAEVVQEGDDCSILVAVTATLSALLLLLLCICIALCYRWRRQAKSSQHEAIRFDQSVSGRSSVAEATGGKVNLGYSVEGLTDAGHSDLIKETHSQMDSVSVHKVPDVVSSSNLSLHSQSQAQVDLAEEHSKSVRRITTV
ncbi:immunoglobulin superfamily member 5 [Centroberyx gerrardi]|uniref:immunoglobulin superfamily member 5 n=1 Tax=Centroberyx gerrardi TaxID=166262 RepID=UPI003AABBCDD